MIDASGTQLWNHSLQINDVNGSSVVNATPSVNALSGPSDYKSMIQSSPLLSSVGSLFSGSSFMQAITGAVSGIENELSGGGPHAYLHCSN